MSERVYSLAHLSSHRCTAPQAAALAAEVGYHFVGLRMTPVAPGAPCQALLGRPEILREVQAVQRNTGVGVFDLEIVRIAADFDLQSWGAFFETGAALGARAVLVAGDDPDEARLAQHYAQLCEAMAPFGLSADLEFMPWTAVPDAATALRVVQAAGNPANAGVLVDALHFGRSRTTLQDLRALPPGLLHYAQLCDGEAGTGFSREQLIHTARSERLFPGEGNIDLGGMVRALPADLPISVEVVHLERERSADPRQWAAQCLAASRRAVQAAEAMDRPASAASKGPSGEA